MSKSKSKSNHENAIHILKQEIERDMKSLDSRSYEKSKRYEVIDREMLIFRIKTLKSELKNLGGDDNVRGLLS